MKVIEFLRYVFKEQVMQVYDDVKEIFLVVTKKKTWVFICFIFLVISLFTNRLAWILGAAFLFLFFFVTYQWQVFEEEYTHQQREKYWKKPKLKG